VAPTFEGWHLFGTDKIGRDYFSRCRVRHRRRRSSSRSSSRSCRRRSAPSSALAGYYGGWLDNLLMRFTDFVIAVPFLAILLVAVAYLGRGSPSASRSSCRSCCGRRSPASSAGNYLSLREKEFVEAAKASGASDFRIMFRHILPNTLGPIIVNATLTVATAILLEATLSFLGFGIQPPTPALGKLIDDGRGAMLTDWWLVTMPGITIVIICLCINFVGDGLRDALDPTQQRK
jgi:ABC-type dipeptide/oligopeptide/nickel transport system permease subunit